MAHGKGNVHVPCRYLPACDCSTSPRARQPLPLCALHLKFHYATFPAHWTASSNCSLLRQYSHHTVLLDTRATLSMDLRGSLNGSRSCNNTSPTLSSHSGSRAIKPTLDLTIMSFLTEVEYPVLAQIFEQVCGPFFSSIPEQLSRILADFCCFSSIAAAIGSCQRMLGLPPTSRRRRAHTISSSTFTSPRARRRVGRNVESA
jgi:hypothetical protein